jgi:hypothetical protein
MKDRLVTNTVGPSVKNAIKGSLIHSYFYGIEICKNTFMKNFLRRYWGKKLIS